MNPLTRFLQSVHALPDGSRKFLAVLGIIVAVVMIGIGWKSTLPDRLGNLDEESTLALGLPLETLGPAAPREEATVVHGRPPPPELASRIAAIPLPEPEPSEIAAGETLSPSAGIAESFRGLKRFFLQTPRAPPPNAPTPTSGRISAWFNELGERLDQGMARVSAAIGDTWQLLQEGLNP